MVSSEVLVRLVAATVFKTVGPYVNRAAGGFDSHALPLFWPVFLMAFSLWNASRFRI